jgi:hypothetical protein
MTNIEKIKSMTAEELAAWLCSLMCSECCVVHCPATHLCRRARAGMVDWLNRETDMEPWMDAVAEIREGDRL